MARRERLSAKQKLLQGARTARAKGLFDIMGTRPTSSQRYSRRPRSALQMAGDRATKLTVQSLQRSVAMHAGERPALSLNSESSMVKSWLAEATSTKGSVAIEKACREKPLIYRASEGALEQSVLVSPELVHRVRRR